MARRFRFRLETVRKLRQQIRDRQRCVVMEKAQAVGQVDERMADLVNELHRTSDGTRTAFGVGRLNVALLQGYQWYRGWLRRKIEESQVERKAKNTVLAVEQAKLAEASKKLRVIEKLRERQWERYRIEQNREEQAASDEAVLHRYGQRSRVR